MTKESFLNQLSEGLLGFPDEQIKEILYDYAEHFQFGYSSGKDDNQIINELGNPYDIIHQYREGYLEKVNTDFNEKEEEDKKEILSKKTSSKFNNLKENTKRLNLSSTIIISIIFLILFGPIVTIALAITSLCLGFLFLGSSGSIIAISVVMFSIKFSEQLGFYNDFADLNNFPMSVFILLIISAGFLFIFSSLLIYCCAKMFMHFCKKFLCWIIPILKEN